MSQVKNRFLAQMATNTLKGNNTGGPSNPLDLTVSQITTMLGSISGSATSSLSERDTNANLSANNFIEGYTTTTTATSTTTLTVSSTHTQYFTGTTTQTVVLPVTGTLVLGQQFLIENRSTGVVTVQSSGANTIKAMEANSQLLVTVILITGTTAASWDYAYSIVQGTLPVADGGTGLISGTSGGILGFTASGTITSSAALTVSQLIIGGGAGATPSTLAAGSQFQPLIMGASIPGYAALNLAQSAATTGVLPSASVGLGRTMNNQTGTTYTFVLGDGSAAGANTLISGNNSSTQTYTIPTNASVAFPVGTQIDILQLGAGKITLSPAGGVTLNANGGLFSTGGQYIAVTLVQISANNWILAGNTVA